MKIPEEMMTAKMVLRDREYEVRAGVAVHLLQGVESTRKRAPAREANLPFAVS